MTAANITHKSSAARRLNTSRIDAHRTTLTCTEDFTTAAIDRTREEENKKIQ
jgi:hypothetical protein